MMRNGLSPLLISGLLLLAALTATGAAAQEAPSLFQFRFANPGARSMGFGGAFAALADDATAAYANPAGLVQLLRPEISLEVRLTAFSISGLPESPNNLSGVGFASLVWPFKRFSLAVYETELTESANPFVSPGLLAGAPGFATFGSFRVRNRGLAGAYRWSDKLSFGFGLSSFDGEFESTTEIYEGPGSAAGVDRILQTRTADGSDVAVAAGFLWHLSRAWNVGGFYRIGPTFDVGVDVIAGPGARDPAAINRRRLIPLVLSDAWGLGAAYQSKNGAVTFSFEWDHLRPSNHLEEADELHLGFEFALIKTSPILVLRLGGWLDPARSTIGLGNDPELGVLFPSRNEEAHVAGGLGLAFRKLKVDVAADVSDPVTNVSLSFVYSF